MTPALVHTPRIHVVTDDEVLERADTVEIAASLLDAFPNVVALHVRGPHTSGRRIFEVASALVDRAGSAGVVINDRVDVALPLGAGVHLGARSLPVAAVRALVPGGTAIGRSVRSHAEEASGADYVFAGPVFRTPSHSTMDGKGVAWMGELVRQTSLPVLAIGGISAERIGVLLKAGAHGVAVIRFVWEASDPLRAVEDLTEQLNLVI